MAVNLGSIWFSVQSNVSSLLRATRAVLTFGQTAQTAAAQTGNFQRSLQALSTTAVLTNGPLGGIAARFQAIAASARHGNLGMVAFVGGIATVVYGVYKLIRASIQAEIQMQQLTKAANAVTGSVAETGESFRYLQDLANKTGTSFTSLAQQFTFLNAAAQGTALEGVRIRQIFSTTAAAAAKLNLGVADTEGIMRSLQQMMSKGTVQAEELRGQLGDRLPGAFRIAAEAMGVTTAQLSDMLKRGEVVAEDFLPRFERALRKSFNVNPQEQVQGILQSWERMQNAIFNLLVAFNDLTNAADVFGNMLSYVTDTVTTWTNMIRQAKDAMDRFWMDDNQLAWSYRVEDAFNKGTEAITEQEQKLQDYLATLQEAGIVFDKGMMKQGKDQRWFSAFPEGSGQSSITDSELENWLKSQKTAGEKAAEGFREAQVTLSKLNMEAEVYSTLSGRDLNIALRELDRTMEINTKIESFSDALRTAGVATGVVNAMTEKYRQTLIAVQNAKILDEETVTTFEYLQDVIGNGLTSAMDNFVGALENGKLTMETLKDTAREVVSHMLKEFIKLAWIAPLMNAAFGQNNPVFSLGGSAAKLVGGSAPLFHNGGIARDEMPAILQKGEMVLSKSQVRRGMGVGGGINYSPTINVQGSADNNTIERLRRMMLTDMERVLPEMIGRGRLSRKF